MSATDELVKRLNEMGMTFEAASYGAEAEPMKSMREAAAELSRLSTALAEKEREFVQVRGQLPDGMEHCTIIFKECEKGHGWLTATNWVQHGMSNLPRRIRRARQRQAARGSGGGTTLACYPDATERDVDPLAWQIYVAIAALDRSPFHVKVEGKDENRVISRPLVVGLGRNRSRKYRPYF